MRWFNSLTGTTRVLTPKLADSSGATSVSQSPGKHPNLSCLPKAPVFRSIRFKRTTQGIAARLLLAPSFTPLVDSSHPIAHIPPTQLWRIVPQYRCPLFQAHAYPQALLNRFEDPHVFKQIKGQGISNELDKALASQSQSQDDAEKTKYPDDSPGAIGPLTSSGDRRRAAHACPMSLVLVTPKKTVHKSTVVRTKIKLKFKEALHLVVIRGARLEANTGSSLAQQKIILTTPEGKTKESVGEVPILKDWTYIIRPTLEIYRCPWPSLIDNVTKALSRLKSQANILEHKWSGEGQAKPHERTKRTVNRTMKLHESGGGGQYNTMASTPRLASDTRVKRERLFQNALELSLDPEPQARTSTPNTFGAKCTHRDPVRNILTKHRSRPAPNIMEIKQSKSPGESEAATNPSDEAGGSYKPLIMNLKPRDISSRRRGPGSSGDC